MRSDEMQVGKQYELSTSRSTPQRVTVLKTPPEVRSQAKVRVQFESGVKKGETGEVASRRILRPWGGEKPQRKKKAKKPQRLPVEMDWPPRPGDQVRWSATSDIPWTVTAVDEDKGVVSLKGRVFGRPQNSDTPLSELSPPLAPDEPVPNQLSRVTAPKSAPSKATRPRVRAVPNSEPQNPLDFILDQVIFTKECLGFYQRTFAPGSPWRQVAKRLRRELRKDGYLFRPRKHRHQGYIHIRVDKRFDAVIEKSPSAGDALIINRLDLPVSKRASQKSKRRTAA